LPVYFITYSVLFWVPVVLFSLFVLRFFESKTRKAYFFSSVIMAGVLVVMEYVCLKFDVWSFSQQTDPLLGIWIGKAPIEEFVYWFGATPFCLALYLSYKRLFEGLKCRKEK